MCISRSDEASPVPAGDRTRLLLADDEEAIRRSYVALLTAHRYEVKAFAHGAGVLEHLKRHDADLVITDLFMPEFDGMELQATLRTRHPELKVIVISGGSCHWAGALQAARQLGAAAVLPKPFEFPELLAAIESVLGRRGERQDDQVEASHDVPAES